MKPYQQPLPHEPHAVVKYRRHFDNVSGTRLSETLVVNGQLGLVLSVSRDEAKVARTDALLVHPGAAHLVLSAAFTHEATRRVTHSYSCGTAQAPRQCTRTTNETYTVTDGSCEKELGLNVSPDERYLVQLNYQDARNCSHSCFVQRPLAGGKFENAPCSTFVIQDD
jgi:hypothetical protein